MWAYVTAVGPEQAAAELRAGRAPAEVLDRTAARRAAADPEADLAAAERLGLRLVGPESPYWPHFAFAALEHAGRARLRLSRGPGHRRSAVGDPVPPLALWVRGTLDPAGLALRSVGLVGSRAATEYGEQVTADLAYRLARRAVTVVSGGAYGIDAAAHRAALAAGGSTVIVSAGGLDRPYPPGNAALFERAAQAGVLLSESPPGCAPQRHRFLTRNRLIAALSTGVVVVEAAARSGALNTAAHARILGRPVMAVPGPVTSAMSVGCHALLRREQDPAVLVACADDVLALVGAAGEGLTEPSTEVADVRSELEALDPVARRVFEGLPARRWVAAEEVAARSGVGPVEVIRALPRLELAGLVEAS